MPWDPHPKWGVKKKEAYWVEGDIGLQSTEVPSIPIGRLKARMAFLVVPSWGKGAGPLCPRINEALDVDYGRKGT